MKNIQQSLDCWNFHFTEAGLASSEQIQHIAESLGLFRPPTIIFSRNQMKLALKDNSWSITFNPMQALRYINYDQRQKDYISINQEPRTNTISYIPDKLYVKHANHWKNIQKPKDIEITQIKQCSDCFFLTPFKGLTEGQCKVQRVHGTVIPVQKLGPSNPFTFYHQGSLYEDELDDNGLIQYEYKFRAMADSWFALIRNYARIDEVTVHIYDTRIYWEKGWKKVARQFMVKTATWQQLKAKEFDFALEWNMNPNQSHMVYPFTIQRFVENEYIHLP